MGKNQIKRLKDVDPAAADSALGIMDLLKAGLGNGRMTRIRLNRIANEVDWIADLIRESERQKYRLFDSYIEKRPELQKDIGKRAKAKAEERMLPELEALKEELASRQGEIDAKKAEREAIEAKTEEKRKELELGLAALENRRDGLEREIAKLLDKAQGLHRFSPLKKDRRKRRTVPFG